MTSENFTWKPDPTYWPPFPSYEHADVDQYDPKVLKILDIEHVMELLTTKLHHLNEKPSAMMQSKALVMPVGRYDQTAAGWSAKLSELSDYQVKKQYECMVDRLLDNLQKMNDSKIEEMRTAFKEYLKAELGSDADKDANAISLDHTTSQSGNAIDSKTGVVAHDFDDDDSESDSGKILTPESSDAGDDSEKAPPRISSWTEEAQITHDFEAARKAMVDKDKYNHFKQSFLRSCEKLYDSDPRQKQIRVRTLPSCRIKPKLELYVPTVQSCLNEQSSVCAEDSDSSKSTDSSSSSRSSSESELEISTTRNLLPRTKNRAQDAAEKRPVHIRNSSESSESSEPAGVFLKNSEREPRSRTEIEDRITKTLARVAEAVHCEIRSANSSGEDFANSLNNNNCVTVSEGGTEATKDNQKTFSKTTVTSPRPTISASLQYAKEPESKVSVDDTDFAHMDSWGIMHFLQSNHGLNSGKPVRAMVASPGGQIVCALAKQDLVMARKMTHHLMMNNVITGELSDSLYEKFKADMFPIKEDELCYIYTWINCMRTDEGIENYDANTSNTMELRAQAEAVVRTILDSESKHSESEDKMSNWGMSEYDNSTAHGHDQNTKTLPVSQDTDRVDEATLTRAEFDIFNIVEQKLKYDDGHKTFVQMSNTAGGKIIRTVVNQDSSAAQDIVLDLWEAGVLTVPQHDKILNRLHYGKPIDYNELAHIYAWVNSLEDKVHQNKALQIRPETHTDKEKSDKDDVSEKRIKAPPSDITAMTHFEFSKFLKIHGHLSSYSRTDIWRMPLTLGGTFVRHVINGQTAKAYLVVFSIRDHTTEDEHEIFCRQISKTPHDYEELARVYEMINELATLKKITLAELAESLEELHEDSLDEI